MEALKLPPVVLPRSPCGRIHLDDLGPIAPPLESNAVVVAERIRRPGGELVQLDLCVHQRVKSTKIPNRPLKYQSTPPLARAWQR
ncbi:MAG: hypothetical protein IPK42_16270 [Betaproteobacteria bacterium]|nr:hypothetical protein [Betaproteobacteria bacterium]